MTTISRDARGLWFAVVGGPAAWTIDALGAVAIDHDYCAHGAYTASGAGAMLPLLGLSLVAALVAILAVLNGWRYASTAGDDTGLGDTHADRRRFTARFGMVISALALFAIVLRMITVFFVSPAIC